MARAVRRAIALLLLIAALAPGTWWRAERAPPSTSRAYRYDRVALPPATELERHLGAFRLEGAWRMTSPHSAFGSYSALVASHGGQRMIAFSDRGFLLRFAPPDAPPRPIALARIRSDIRDPKVYADAESATMDPRRGTVWVGWESGNKITRHDPAGRAVAIVAPPQMRGWGVNEGPEAIARLADGRFIVLREGYDGWFDFNHHRALIFPGDPIDNPRAAEFTFAGSPGFKPVDMAQLPDGRVLILMRRLVWPMPPRFAGRIMIADPRDIRPGAIWRATEVAKLSSSLPIDNFEGMAIVPAADGRVTVWLISDDNQAVSQRTLLWKLVVNPRRLPGSVKPGSGKPRASKKAPE